MVTFITIVQAVLPCHRSSNNLVTLTPRDIHFISSFIQTQHLSILNIMIIKIYIYHSYHSLSAGEVRGQYGARQILSMQTNGPFSHVFDI